MRKLGRQSTVSDHLPQPGNCTYINLQNYDRIPGIRSDLTWLVLRKSLAKLAFKQHSRVLFSTERLQLIAFTGGQKYHMFVS